MMGDSYVICSCQFNNSVTRRVEKRERMREVINFIQVSIFCEWLRQIFRDFKNNTLFRPRFVCFKCQCLRKKCSPRGCMKLTAQ